MADSRGGSLAPEPKRLSNNFMTVAHLIPSPWTWPGLIGDSSIRGHHGTTTDGMAWLPRQLTNSKPLRNIPEDDGDGQLFELNFKIKHSR